MKIKAITIDLSDEQIAQAQPAFTEIEAMADAGNPGMCLAQVFVDRIKVFVVTSDQAMEMQRIMGSPVGLTTQDIAKREAAE